jgi:SEC-C motif
MPKTVLSPASAVTKAALALLAAGPLHESILVPRLVADGLVLGDDPEDRLLEVLDPDRVVELDDERLVDVVALADGVVFSHTLGANEIALGRVMLHPDLSVLDDLESAGVALAARGGRLDHDHDGDDADVCVLVGPDGWLGADAAAGDLLCVTVGLGATSTEVVPGPFPVMAEAVEALRAAFEMLSDDEEDPEPVELFTVWLEAVVANPEAFRRRLAPMSQLLAAADLEAHGDLVAPAGFDWDDWDSALELERVTRRWRLDEAGALAWVIVSTAYERFAGGELPEAGPDIDADEIWAGLAAMTSYGTVAQAFVGETLEKEPDLDGSVSLFAERLVEAASGKTLAGPRWLAAICAERDGRTLEAEALVTQSVAADGSFLPALEDAAWYAADRGDARRAASLLRRAGADADDDMLAVYDHYARVPAAPVGRNDRCPCGSGRKYKHCHLGKAALPLSERCEFLYRKAGAFLLRGVHGRLLYEIATTLAGDDPMGLRDAIMDPIVGDLTLFESGGWGDFLTARGMLLPTDELFLAQQWQLIERSVHEIQAVEPGRSLTARDVRTGDVVTVRERSASGQLAVGDLICARIVPDGEGYQIFGGIEMVGLHQRDPLIALLDSHPSGVELAEWFAAAHAPPRLVNYENEPLVVCTLTYTVEEPHEAVVVLDKILEATNPGEWVETVETEQMERTIRGFVRLDADTSTLTVETNSEARADRLDLLLQSELPGLRPLDDVRIPAADAVANQVAMGLSDDPPPFPEGAAEFMAQLIGDYERKWLDMSLPALAGLTPRQAADDPTRREDLLALLTSFERHESPEDTPSGFMSAARLRALLEII